MVAFLEKLNTLVWGIPALLGILGIGIYLSFRTGWPQIRLLPKALRAFLQTFRKKEQNDGGVSPFQALCTALAATVGTGNLAGVAGAIAIGGPGSVFWMWICAILGMITKFAEAALSVRYRVKNEKGEWVGGPMYMIQQGMGKRWRWLAMTYCFFGIVAAFGVGNATQVNTVIGGINQAVVALGGQESQLGNLLMGIALSILICGILLGGLKKIGSMAEKLVPLASVCYLLLGLGVLIARAQLLPHAFYSIVTGAFTPQAATGGAIGSLFLSLRVGVSRGVFTNEAGMGTAGIAHAAAQVDHPVQQGLMGIMEVFLDTIVICTMTALVILVSGIKIPYGKDIGVTLTTQAFSSVYGDWVSVMIAASLCCFAIATVLGWGLYGARCAQFLFGDGVWKKFVFLQGVAVVLGAVLQTGTVWLLSEIVNGLMAIPNLLALGFLAPELSGLVRQFRKKDGRKFCAKEVAIL
ncbi:MAG: sodium:alanine symporter family protein [Ruminococcaceae bacterium]|nr:sodium:alanine symporter family protein [Oscillospiraceae bacterium]